MKKMLLNVIHRADNNAACLDALRFQQDEAHKHGFRTNILVTYSSLFDKDTIEYVKSQRELYGDEIGIHFHGLVCEDYKKRFGTEEKAIYLLPFGLRKKVIRFIFEKFESIYGFMPEVMGSYILDSKTLQFIKEQYPFVKVSIINCFEEGIKMYQGNDRGWYLFSDGGPWGIYYPSKRCHLCPAENEQEAIGIIGLPHLNRDMVLSVVSRDDYFSSHPVNLVRGMVNIGDKCNYMLHFIDQWVKQLEYNPFVYYSLFVSPPWLAPGNSFVENCIDARSLYSKCLEYLKHLQDQGIVQSMTMGQVADWYRENIKYNQPEVNLWEDILFGSKRQMLWYVDAYMRVAVDMNAGGAIVDLRPLTGRVDRNMGPDTDNLWNGNYPFIISSEHRGGVEIGPVQTCEVLYKGKTVPFTAGRVKAHIVNAGNNTPVLVTEPMQIHIEDITVTVLSKFLFPGNGVIEIERHVEDISDPNAEIELREVHRGCWGTNEYPEDLRGITLCAESEDGVKQVIDYAYESRSIVVDNPQYLAACIPQVNCKVVLKPQEKSGAGEVKEGYMFRPFYTLSQKKTVRKGESLKTFLEVTGEVTADGVT